MREPAGQDRVDATPIDRSFQERSRRMEMLALVSMGALTVLLAIMIRAVFA